MIYDPEKPEMDAEEVNLRRRLGARVRTSRSLATELAVPSSVENDFMAP